MELRGRGRPLGSLGRRALKAWGGESAPGATVSSTEWGPRSCSAPGTLRGSLRAWAERAGPPAAAESGREPVSLGTRGPENLGRGTRGDDLAIHPCSSLERPGEQGGRSRLGLGGGQDAARTWASPDRVGVTRCSRPSASPAPRRTLGDVVTLGGRVLGSLSQLVCRCGRRQHRNRGHSPPRGAGLWGSQDTGSWVLRDSAPVGWATSFQHGLSTGRRVAAIVTPDLIQLLHL